MVVGSCGEGKRTPDTTADVEEEKAGARKTNEKSKTCPRNHRKKRSHAWRKCDTEKEPPTALGREEMTKKEQKTVEKRKKMHAVDTPERVGENQEISKLPLQKKTDECSGEEEACSKSFKKEENKTVDVS